MSVTSANIYDFAYQKRLFGLRPNVATNPIPSNRDEILRININSIYINIDPLGNKIVQKCRTALSAVTFILPAAVSPAIFSHASIYVPVSENEGVWIEYGAYDDKRSGEFQGQVHYFQGRNGLRFAKMSIEEFNRRKSSGGTLYETIKCKVRNQMTIGNLFQAISMNDSEIFKFFQIVFHMSCLLFSEEIYISLPNVFASMIAIYRNTGIPLCLIIGPKECSELYSLFTKL